MFILLLTNILTCRMQELKSLDNLSNYNKFVYIFQAVLNIFLETVAVAHHDKLFSPWIFRRWMMVPCRVFKLWRPHKWNTRNQLFPLHLKKVERWIKEMGKRKRILCFWEFHKVNFYSCLIFPCNYLIYIRTYRYIYTGCRKRLSVVVYFDDPNSQCTES